VFPSGCPGCPGVIDWEGLRGNRQEQVGSGMYTQDPTCQNRRSLPQSELCRSHLASEVISPSPCLPPASSQRRAERVSFTGHFISGLLYHLSDQNLNLFSHSPLPLYLLALFPSDPSRQHQHRRVSREQDPLLSVRQPAPPHKLPPRPLPFLASYSYILDTAPTPRSGTDAPT
jgi:hypothetical protein